jgi:hypothetical protein
MPNPARIPVRRVVLRAAPGIALWFLSSSVLALGLCRLAGRLGLHAPWQRSEFWCAIVFGLLTPHLLSLKDLLIPYAAAQRVPRTFRTLQTWDEMTRLYLKRIVAREERKINQDFFDVRLHEEELARRQEALQRVFEFHQVEIALDRRRRLRNQSPKNVLAVFHFRRRDLIFKLLLRFLGVRRALLVLEAVARQPDLLPKQTGMTVARHLESPYVRAYVLSDEARL